MLLYFGLAREFEYEKVFDVVARRHEHAYYLIASPVSSLYIKFNVTTTPQIFFFRNFEHNYTVYNRNYTAYDLERWVIQNSAPLVFEYSHEYAQHVFIHKHMTVFFFRNPKSRAAK